MASKMHRLLVGVLLAVAMQSCIAYRFLGHGAEGIDDFETFPTDTIHASGEPFRFAVGECIPQA